MSVSRSALSLTVAGIALVSMLALASGVGTAAPVAPDHPDAAASSSAPCMKSLEGGAVSHAGPGAGNAFHAGPPEGCKGGGGGGWSNCIVIDASQTWNPNDEGVFVFCPDDATAGGPTGLP